MLLLMPGRQQLASFYAWMAGTKMDSRPYSVDCKDRLQMTDLIVLSLILEGEPYFRPVLSDLPVLQPYIQLLDLCNAKVPQSLCGPVHYGLDCIFPAGLRGSDQLNYFVYISVSHLSTTPKIVKYNRHF